MPAAVAQKKFFTGTEDGSHQPYKGLSKGCSLSLAAVFPPARNNPAPTESPSTKATQAQFSFQHNSG